MLALPGLAAVLAASPQDRRDTSWSVQSGDVRVVCPLTIGGSFEAKTRMIAGMVRPGATPDDAWAGELTVALESLETGISLRDQHLRDNYLEVGKAAGYSSAVMREIRLSGKARDLQGGKGAFTATLRLHGVEKSVQGQAEFRRSGPMLHVRASFPVTLQDFGIARPRYLGVGVRDVVTVQVAFDTTGLENVR